MWFRISKASNLDEKPHRKAIMKKGYIVDERTVDSPEKLGYSIDRRTWYDRGVNHRVENGHIKRDLEIEDWYIEINFLHDLMELIEDCGNSVVVDTEKIIIYDDYLE